MNYYQKTKEEIFKEFQTSEKGLSDSQVKNQQKIHGKNQIKRLNRLRPIKIFFEQFHSLLIYILLASSIIMLILGKMLDAGVIFAIVLLNSGIGFVQQYKAEKAIIGLKKMIISKTRVMRNGVQMEIPSSELVPGDIVFYEAGDKVGADCRILESENLETNEAILTGESMPVSKDNHVIKKQIELTKQKNMIFAGTRIVKGDTKAIVVSTGSSTSFGNIAQTLQEIKPQETPMQKRMNKFSKQLSIVIFVLVGLILLAGIIQGFSFFDMFMTSVTLAIGAIPEGLPAVLAIAFAISSVFMYKKNVIIRRLPAVETLGSVSVICSDKTGTITQEEMKVQKIFSGNNIYIKKGNQLYLKNKKIHLKSRKEVFDLIKTSVLCNDSRYEKSGRKYNLLGEPTENSLLSNSLDLGFDKKILTEQEPDIKKFEFTSERKKMSILRDSKKGYTLYTKGAPEKIINSCTHELISGKVKKLTTNRKKELFSKSSLMEKDALRTLGFAYKKTSKKDVKENNLIFLGFIGMIDPPRKEVRGAIEKCKKAGIKIKIITGDSPVTARAISEKIGIKGDLITGPELEKMTDSDLLNKIDKIEIFARVTPKEKLRITKILQSKGEVVAITGDGINDVLALKSADIGIAMGMRGTDVARDVSDVVLADDNFASIVEGVSQGRKTYDNIKKFAKYMLSVNFSGILLISFSMIMASIFSPETWYLPLLPLQILWVNLITDSFPALTLALEKSEGVLSKKPQKEESILDNIWKFVLIAGLFTLCIKIIAYSFGIFSGFTPEKTRTIVLTTVVLFEIFFVYTCRSNEFILNKKFFSNKWLNIAILFSLVLHMILLFTPLSTLFGVVAITSIKEWIIIIALSLSGLLVFEFAKMIRNIKKTKSLQKSS